MQPEIGFLQKVQRHLGDHFRTGNGVEPLVVGIELTDPIRREPFKRLAVLQLVTTSTLAFDPDMAPEDDNEGYNSYINTLL